MTELQKTVAIVGVALAITGASYLTGASRSETDAAFQDQGQEFFPNFKDPAACTDLGVVGFDAQSAAAQPFQVMLKDGKWVIPSHHDYPADAKDRLAKTAAGVIDLRKDTVRSDRAEDHEELGVVDPLDRKTSTLKGRGKRVTLKDSGGQVLADFILGHEVRERPGQRYVRVPGQKRTYGVNVKVDLSTRFADWIETNLLGLDAGKVRKLVVDNHKVDPEMRKVESGDLVELARKDGSAPWSMADVPTGKELDADKVREMTTALVDLKIVGVRTKPAGLTRDLKAGTSGKMMLSPRARLSLQDKGYYALSDGRLLSNQGDVIVSTDEGAVYTLRYGEVVFASGEDLSAGSTTDEEEAKAKETNDPAKKQAEGELESRFLLVTVAFDPTLIPEPKPDPVTEPELPAEPFLLDPGDPKRVAEEKARQEKADRLKSAREKLLADGQKRVEELTDRFADWYYVTPGDSFRKVVLDRAALIRDPKPPGAGPGEGIGAGDPHGGLPGFPGGLPPGLLPRP